MKGIGFGKFNRFYWLILFSTLFKIWINIFFKIQLQRYVYIENISILKSPLLNDHIFVRFIYYYFGFVILGFIYIKALAINKEFFKNEIFKEKYKRALRPILLVVIIYIASKDMVIWLYMKCSLFI